MDQAVDSGSSVSFSVSATADEATSYVAGNPIYGSPGNADSGINYQWWLGNPFSGGTILTDGEIYTGTQSSTLSISNSGLLDGQDFCVVITHDNNGCEDIYCAILSVSCNSGASDAPNLNN